MPSAMSSETEIRNLLYRYAELIDSGDLPGAAALFAHARIHRRERAAPMTGEDILGFWQARIILYPCGTPRTKHVVTNAIVEIDEVAGTATSRSYYTVVQATGGFPLQMIAQGRYHDAFERVDGRWRFAMRDYSLLDMKGDLSRHLVDPPLPTAADLLSA